jgi:DNA-binding GntR family transcriptional regulator
MLVLQHDMDDYMKPHQDFHRLLISQLPTRLLATAERLFSRTERYRRFYSAHTAQSAVIAAAEHRQLLEACRSRDAKLAAKVLAEHYTRTALHVLAVLAPGYEPRAVRAALAIFDSQPSRQPTVAG